MTKKLITFSAMETYNSSMDRTFSNRQVPVCGYFCKKANKKKCTLTCTDSLKSYLCMLK